MSLQSNQRLLLIGAAVAIAAIGYFFFGRGPSGGSDGSNRIQHVFAKRVLSGHAVTLKDDLELVYMGIRAPYENEPLYEESRKRNEQLVVGKQLRLRFEAESVDRKGRILAYAFLEDETCINVKLVSEGLAYARLTPDVKLYFNQILQAQVGARAAGRGIWRAISQDDESTYPADPKYAEFHRPSCEVALKIKPERLIAFSKKDEAFAKGFVPCNKCQP